MNCLTCERRGVLYPVIDRYTERVACPYCGALDSLIPGEGETEETMAERLKFAQAQGWRFMMQVTSEVKAKPWLEGYTPVMYAMREGEMLNVDVVLTERLAERIERFKKSGILTIEVFNPTVPGRWTTKDIEPHAVIVTEAKEYLYKVPKVQQV